MRRLLDAAHAAFAWPTAASWAEMRDICFLAWRQLLGRPGLAWLALGCIAIGIAARGTIAGSVAAIEDHLAIEARYLLAGDIEVSSPRPLDAHVRDAVAHALPADARTTEVRCPR